MKDTPTFEVFPQIDPGTHAGEIVQLLATPDGRSLVSAGETTMRVWDAAGRRLRRLLLGRVNGATDDGAIDGKISCMAISRDSRWLVALSPWRHQSLRGADAASSHDAGRVTEVMVFELATGNLRSRFVHPGQLLDLDFSPDGRWLALTCNVRVGARRQVEVLLLATRELLRPGVRAAPPSLARLALAPPRRVTTVTATLRFVPARAYAPRTAPATLVVAIGEAAGARGQLSWLQVAQGSGAVLTLARTVGTDEALSVATLAVSASMAAVGAAPPAGRGLRGRLLWFGHDGDRAGAVVIEAPAASAAFSPSGHRLAVGLMVDPDGPEDAPSGTQTVQTNVYECVITGPVLRSTYFGHDGTVAGLAFVDDDVVASSGGDNHAIHFWGHAQRVADAKGAIRGMGRVAIEPGITADERVLFGTVPRRLLPPGHPVRQQSFDLRRMQLATTAASDLRRRDFASRKWRVGYRDDMVIPLWFIGTEEGVPAVDPSVDEPDLNLFVGADDSWVIWSRSGYYNAGGGDAAARRIGYRVNRGVHQEALLVPSDRFKTFYKPEIIQAIVRHGTERRARQQGVDIPDVDVTCILPPIAELARDGIQLDGASASFVFTVEAPCPEYKPTRASLQRNGRVVWTQTQLPARSVMRLAVPAQPLLPGVNRFTFHVENAQARSVPVEFEIDGPARTEAELDADAPGWLFLLSVGVGEFIKPGNELQFPKRDAEAVFNALVHGQLKPGSGARQHGTKRTAEPPRNRAFEFVDATLLVNAQATKAAILDEVRRMCVSIRERHARAGAERDVLFVFLSGHGVKLLLDNVPSLFFQNHDLEATPERLRETGLSMLELGEHITSVPAEVVLVLDTCNAGLAGSGAMASLDAEELARRVHAIYERGMYVVSAARADELASEDDSSQLGVLTAALLRALQQVRPRARGAGSKGQAQAGRPLNRGGARELDVLMTEVLSGVQRLLPEVTAAAGADPQTPVCRIYGDLLPLTILKTRPAGSGSGGRERGAAALQHTRGSRKVRRSSTLEQGRLTMATRKAASKTVAAEKVTAAKKVAAQQAPAKKAAAKVAPAKKAPAKTAPAKKAPAKKAPAKKAAPAKAQAPKAPAKKAAAKKASPVKAAPRKAAAKKSRQKPGPVVVISS